jgi:hypothetical protein
VSSSVWQMHRSWALRAMLVLAATALLEAAVVWLAPRPVLWAALVAGTLPLTLVFFVAFPLIRRAGGKAAL